MRVWAHDRFAFPLPDGHRFPLTKYRRLRERLIADGTIAAGDVHESPPAGWDELALVHDRDYLAMVRDGTMTRRQERAVGLPWSAELVERGRRSTQGTVLAVGDALASGLGVNLGGGTHHAGRAQARGYCLFNDVALAVALLRARGDRRRVLIVDTDVHQGDGTAELLGGDGDPDVFALSIHGGANYPFKRATSDLDIDLPTGTGDDAYLEALGQAMRTAGGADLLILLAGADPWEGDALGRLALTKAGLRGRDALVIAHAREHGAALTVVLAGGYAPDVEDTVDINAASIAAAVAYAGNAARSGATST